MEETRWKEKNQYLGLTEDGRRVRLLDQSQLPNREVWLELEEPEELAEAIRTLRVRGAPAIGVTAAYAYCRAPQPSASLRRMPCMCWPEDWRTGRRWRRRSAPGCGSGLPAWRPPGPRR